MAPHFRRSRAALLALATPLVLYQPAAAQSPGDKDLAAISSYILTMPKYKQYLAASLNLAKAAAANPEMAKGMEDSGNLSIDQMVAKFNAVPPIKSAITSSGLTTRDFALMQGAMLQTGMAYAIMKQYKMSKDSVVKTAKVNPANLDFYAQNEAEITRLANEMTAQAPKTEEAESRPADEEADSTE